MYQSGFVVTEIIRLSIQCGIKPDTLALLISRMPDTELNAVGGFLSESGLNGADKATGYLKDMATSLNKQGRL